MWLCDHVCVRVCARVCACVYLGGCGCDCGCASVCMWMEETGHRERKGVGEKSTHVCVDGDLGVRERGEGRGGWGR